MHWQHVEHFISSEDNKGCKVRTLTVKEDLDQEFWPRLSSVSIPSTPSWPRAQQFWTSAQGLPAKNCADFAIINLLQLTRKFLTIFIINHSEDSQTFFSQYSNRQCLLEYSYFWYLNTVNHRHVSQLSDTRNLSQSQCYILLCYAPRWSSTYYLLLSPQMDVLSWECSTQLWMGTRFK